VKRTDKPKSKKPPQEKPKFVLAPGTVTAEKLLAQLGIVPKTEKPRQTLQETLEQLRQEMLESVPRQFGKTDEPACPPKRHITSVAKNFVRPTIRESLERGFGLEAEFYVAEGSPIAVWPDWDYAENWSAYPIREVHPFHPVLHGKKITEAEFRTLVKAMHNLS
jgi:hypothetical protein